MLSDVHTRKVAISATKHCLIGCGIGEVSGMVVGTALGWSNLATICLAIFLAFVFGYSFTFFPLRKGLGTKKAAKTALAADTASITTMEIVDSLILVIIPGALHAHLTDTLFWVSLMIALAVAFVVTVPVNYWMIARGKGHAVMYEHHGHH